MIQLQILNKILHSKDLSILTENGINRDYFLGYENEYDALMKDVEGAQITAWWNRAVDIIPAGGGKGNGIHKVLEYYHFTPEEAIAFGDGTNDIEMLEAVGTGVAMGNATDNVKAIADDICLSVSEDGVYHYCLDHKLI